MATKSAPIGSIERIIEVGTLGETRISHCAGVLKVEYDTGLIPDDEVRIIIIIKVDKYGRVIRTCIDVVERIGRVSTLRETGIDRCTGVLIVMDVAVIISDSKVRVTVTVQVSQCKRAP